MDKNSIHISGKIVVSYKSGNVLITILRVTKRVNDKIVTDFPHICWFGDNVGRVAQFDQYSRVVVDGFIRTKVKEINGVKNFYQNIVGTDIKEWANMSDNTINELIAEGEVKNVYSPSSKVTLMRIRTKTDDTDSHINFNAYGNLAEFAKCQLTPGDRVRITASVESQKYKDKAGKEISKDIFVCSEIEKIPN